MNEYLGHFTSKWKRRFNDLTGDQPARRYIFQRLYGMLFRLGFSQFGAIFLNYHPDSFYVYKLHQEYYDLFSKFKMKNKWGNGGDIVRLWSFILNIKQIINENIEGDFAELGVWKGNSAAILATLASSTSRSIFLFDTFEGFNKNDLRGIDKDKPGQFTDTSIEFVKNVLGKANKNCYYVKGYFPDSLLEEHKSREYAVVSLDCDLYEPMKAGLEFFYPRMPRGGIFLLHDYSNIGWNGAKLAVDQFCQKTGEFIVLLPDKSGSAFFRKTKPLEPTISLPRK